ncbi:MAG: fimbrillin family protein [Bacteroidaceae bacterium]|nr:fimbrillin family protein [Bacteroidaceae bacterium]
MKKIFFFTFLTAAFLAACSSDDQYEPKQEPRLITVEVTENPLLDANGTPKQLPTRTAAATTSETLSAFFMNYEESQYNIYKKADGSWNTNPDSWPVTDNSKIDFYAYNAGTFLWNSGKPYLSFKMDASAFNQTDLLVATHKAISYNDAGGKVSLDFDHACAAVKFNIYKTAGVGEKTVTVTSVVLSGVKNQGDYHYNDEETKWQSLSVSADSPLIDGYTPASYTLTTGAITLTTEKQALPCGYLFLIPQSKEGLKLTVNYTVNSVAAEPKTFSLTGTWEAGTEYIVNISMGTSIIK